MSSRRRESGFTLIEITFAVIVLASSLIVLLGLQSASVTRAVRDRNGLEAMLIAREILTAIETREDIDTLQSTVGSVDEVLREVLIGERTPAQVLDREQRYRAELTVAEIEIPILSTTPQKLKQLTLRVSWGDTPQDEVSVLYYLSDQ